MLVLPFIQWISFRRPPLSVLNGVGGTLGRDAQGILFLEALSVDGGVSTTIATEAVTNHHGKKIWSYRGQLVNCLGSTGQFWGFLLLVGVVRGNGQ